MSKPKVAKLSFDMDEEEEEVFVVKKNVDGNNKKFKKMRQAPTALASLEVEKPQPAYASFGSSYSSETLDQLRNNQKFAVKSSVESVSMMEGVELSGDAAEEFTRITESLNKDSNGTGVSEEIDDNADDTEDFIAFHKGQKESKSLLKGKTDNRMYTNVKQKKEEFDLSVENDTDWEAEVMRRGAINLKPTLSGSKLSSNVLVESTDGSGAVLREVAKYPENRVDGSGGVMTVEDSVKLVQMAIDRLRVSAASNDSRVSLLTASRAKAAEAIQKDRVLLEEEVEKLNVLQVRH